MKKQTFIFTLTKVDILTISGLFAGILSIGLALSGRYSFSLALLFIAMLIDAMDGIVARKLGMESDFGRYLDGFVDVIDYLISPALFLYLWGFNSWYYNPILMIFVASGVIRLSVFNVIGNVKDDNDSLSYLGMPVFWSALFLGVIYMASIFIAKEIVFPIIALYLLLSSVLMVYNKKFYKFKNWKAMLFVILIFTAFFTIDGLGLLPREDLLLIKI